MRPRSLRFKMIALVVGIVAGSSLAASAVQGWVAFRALRDDTRRLAASLASDIAFGIIVPEELTNRELLSAEIRNIVAARQSILWIDIYALDRNQLRPVASSREPVPFWPDPLVIRSFAEERALTVAGTGPARDTWVAAAPVRISGRKAGVVMLAMSLEGANQLALRLNQQLLFVLIMASVSAILSLALYTEYSINRPIRALLDSMGAAERGNLSAFPVIRRKDEMGRLGEGLARSTRRAESSWRSRRRTGSGPYSPHATSRDARSSALGRHPAAARRWLARISRPPASRSATPPSRADSSLRPAGSVQRVHRAQPLEAGEVAIGGGERRAVLDGQGREVRIHDQRPARLGHAHEAREDLPVALAGLGPDDARLVEPRGDDGRGVVHGQGSRQRPRVRRDAQEGGEDRPGKTDGGRPGEELFEPRIVARVLADRVLYEIRFNKLDRAKLMADKLARDPAAHWVNCPACLKVAEHYPEGILTLCGSYLWNHEKEIRQLLDNALARCASRNPLERVIRMQRSGDAMIIETTHSKLAEQLGRTLRKSHSGELQIDWQGAPVVCRVQWERQN